MIIEKSHIIIISSKLLIQENKRIMASEIADKINRSRLVRRGVTAHEVSGKLVNYIKQDNIKYMGFEQSNLGYVFLWKG